MESESVHFTVTGEFLTEHARDLVLEGNWEKAIDFLRASLMGFSYDFAIAVCSGIKKLTGNSDINIGLEPDDCKPFIEQVQWMYAGYYTNIGDSFYMPYAYVDNYGRRDVEPVEGAKIEFDPESHQRSYSYRVYHYMNEPKNDLVFVLSVPKLSYTSVLFRRVPAPPLWLRGKITKSPQVALDAYLKTGRVLDSRGHQQWYGIDDESLLPLFVDGEPETSKIVAEEAKEDEKPVKIIKSTRDLSSDYGWISADGKFYVCDYGGHSSLADAICRQILSIDTVFGERALEDHGWIKVTRNSWDNEPAFFRRKSLTQAQINTIFDWHETHGITMPDMEELYGYMGDR